MQHESNGTTGRVQTTRREAIFNGIAQAPTVRTKNINSNGTVGPVRLQSLRRKTPGGQIFDDIRTLLVELEIRVDENMKSSTGRPITDFLGVVSTFAELSAAISEAENRFNHWFSYVNAIPGDMAEAVRNGMEPLRQASELLQYVVEQIWARNGVGIQHLLGYGNEICASGTLREDLTYGGHTNSPNRPVVNIPNFDKQKPSPEFPQRERSGFELHSQGKIKPLFSEDPETLPREKRLPQHVNCATGSDPVALKAIKESLERKVPQSTEQSSTISRQPKKKSGLKSRKVSQKQPSSNVRPGRKGE